MKEPTPTRRTLLECLPPQHPQQFKLPWTRASEASLLELVRQKLFLWNHKDPLYSKTKVKQGAFDAMAKELREEYPGLCQLNGG